MASPNADGTYTFVPSGLVFTSGMTITAAASGGDVPAFSAPVTMPDPVVVTDPATPTGVIIDRTQPRTFSWTPGAGDVYVYIDDLGAQNLVYPLTIGTVVRCVAPSAGGSTTIPTSILGLLAAGDATIAITGIAAAELDVGGFAVQIRAINYDYVGTITIQ
jgi:hypothetical protein